MPHQVVPMHVLESDDDFMEYVINSNNRSVCVWVHTHAHICTYIHVYTSANVSCNVPWHYTFLPVCSIGEQQCVALIKLQYFIRKRLAVRSLCHFSYHVYVVAPLLILCRYHPVHTHTTQAQISTQHTHNTHTHKHTNTQAHTHTHTHKHTHTHTNTQAHTQTQTHSFSIFRFHKLCVHVSASSAHHITQAWCSTMTSLARWVGNSQDTRVH